WTVNKLLIQSRFTNSRFMVVDGDNVDCCEEMSHECPTDARPGMGKLQKLTHSENPIDVSQTVRTY
ncbi:hypothetical protein N9980_01670, partial [bacterium]|nr:hypothetical protein [bacterium]